MSKFKVEKKSTLFVALVTMKKAIEAQNKIALQIARDIGFSEVNEVRCARSSPTLVRYLNERMTFGPLRDPRLKIHLKFLEDVILLAWDNYRPEHVPHKDMIEITESEYYNLMFPKTAGRPFKYLIANQAPIMAPKKKEAKNG